jgi:hypothetical protein
MKRKIVYIDPPSGWRYGFPKVRPENITDTDKWLVENGYPQSEIDSLGDHFYCGYSEFFKYDIKIKELEISEDKKIMIIEYVGEDDPVLSIDEYIKDNIKDYHIYRLKNDHNPSIKILIVGTVPNLINSENTYEV